MPAAVVILVTAESTAAAETTGTSRTPYGSRDAGVW